MSQLEIFAKQVFQDKQPLTLEESRALIQEARHALKGKELLGEIQSDWLDAMSLYMQYSGLKKEEVYKQLTKLRERIIAWYDATPAAGGK